MRELTERELEEVAGGAGGRGGRQVEPGGLFAPNPAFQRRLAEIPALWAIIAFIRRELAALR
jgi:hypothetical protein